MAQCDQFGQFNSGFQKFLSGKVLFSFSRMSFILFGEIHIIDTMNETISYFVIHFKHSETKSAKKSDTIHSNSMMEMSVFLLVRSWLISILFVCLTSVNCPLALWIDFSDGGWRRWRIVSEGCVVWWFWIGENNAFDSVHEGSIRTSWLLYL